jgi:hypothetical protein
MALHRATLGSVTWESLTRRFFFSSLATAFVGINLRGFNLSWSPMGDATADNGRLAIWIVIT